MKKIFSLAVTCLIVAANCVDAEAAPVESRFNLSIGGYVKLDYVHQSAKLGLPLSTTIPADGTLAARQDESIFSARQSRLNLRANGPELHGAKTSAFIEGDFYGGGGSNETGNLRMRHAYGVISWESTQLLFGQFWDIFGPAVAATIDFRSGALTGAPNNPRVPQARITHSFDLSENNKLRVIGGVQSPVQNFTGPAESGSMVNVAGQAMLVSKALGTGPGYFGLPMVPLTAGFFGLYGNQEFEEAEGKSDIDVYGYGAYAFVPLLKSDDGKSRVMTMSLETQAYVAAGLSVPGAIGATAQARVGAAGDRDAAKGYGVFGQLIFYPTQNFGITAGYGRRNIKDSSDYTGAAEKYNEQYFANVAYDFNPAVRVAAEYQRLNTKYLDIPAGATSDEGSADALRLAAFYFF